MKKYAGIGARSTPNHIIKLMEDLGCILAKKGALLRSGGANGADVAFERGCNKGNGQKKIFRPSDDISVECQKLAEKYHPNWSACSWFAKKAHSRNCQIVLGENLDSPVDAILCWTEKGQVVGGTGQALRLAKAYNIKILNLGNDADYRTLSDYVKENWKLC